MAEKEQEHKVTLASFAKGTIGTLWEMTGIPDAAAIGRDTKGSGVVAFVVQKPFPITTKIYAAQEGRERDFRDKASLVAGVALDVGLDVVFLTSFGVGRVLFEAGERISVGVVGIANPHRRGQAASGHAGH